MANAAFSDRWNFQANDAQQTEVCMNIPAVAMAWSRGGNTCGGPATWDLGYNATHGYWGWNYEGVVGGEPMHMTEGAAGGYTGYLAGPSGNNAMMVFPQGLLLSSSSMGTAPGPERLIDEGSASPTEASHKQGDVRFDQVAGPNGYAGWINTADGVNFKPFGAVQGNPPTFDNGACGGSMGIADHGTDAFTVNTGTGACTPTFRLDMAGGNNGWVCDANDMADVTTRIVQTSTSYGTMDLTRVSVGASPAAVNFLPNHTIHVKCTWY
jgi:hypothetical protein